MIHNSAEQAILTFGKFKGYSLAHVYYNNQSYLTWMTQTVGIPEVWKEAAQLTLKGEDISHLKIAKTNNPTSTFTPQVSTDTAVTIHLKDSKTAVVVMPVADATEEILIVEAPPLTKAPFASSHGRATRKECRASQSLPSWAISRRTTGNAPTVA